MHNFKIIPFLFLLFHLFSVTNAYIPLPGLYWHSYTLVNNKLYFKTEESSNQFFYLDVSKSFVTTNISNIPWADLTLTGFPTRDRDAACANNGSIFFIGGNIPASDSYGLVAQYDIVQQQWKAPTISGTVPKNKPVSVPCTSTKDGLIYVFSTDNQSSVSEMNILNTVSLAWSSGSLVGAPLLAGGGGFTATLLPNDTILYIGGEDNKGNMVSWDKLSLYNIKNDTWSYIATSGVTPSSRIGHSAVLTSDGRVLIFGGYPVSQFIVLDINSYQWSYPSVDSLNGRPAPQLSFHTATLLGKYMFIAFGNGPNGYQTDVYLMDVSDKDHYQWTNSYDSSSFLNSASSSPSPSSSSSSSPQSSSSSTTLTIIVSLVVIGFTILLIAAILITIMIIRKIKKTNHSEKSQLIYNKAVL